MKKIEKTILLSITVLIVMGLTTMIDGVIDYYKEPLVSYDISSIPDYTIDRYIIINENKPDFKDSDYETKSFEKYSDLDLLGRAGVAMANIGIDMMPTTKRESIGTVKPSGWQTVKYDFIDGKYLYNRCHLIGFQLTGENANPHNLITCTRSMNATYMLKFENEVAKYVKEKDKNVLYRVTPIYDGVNLLAKGVQIEAASVEDRCNDICFNVFIYNVEDGVEINYSNGDSSLKN